MPSPFPGMDPWLENPSRFAGLHSLLVTYAVELLQPQLFDRGYFITANERVWVEKSRRNILPDVAVLRWKSDRSTRSTASLAEADESVKIRRFKLGWREVYLEIYDKLHHKLITAIEFLTPIRKCRSTGRKLYRTKQRKLQTAGVNMVEVDLLRRGRPIVLAPPGLTESVKPWDYLVCLWRAHEDEDFDLYRIPLRSRLPRIRIPLKPKEVEPVLDLQLAFDKAYDAGPYRVSVDYQKPPAPPLDADDEAWARQLLQSTKQRDATK